MTINPKIEVFPLEDGKITCSCNGRKISFADGYYIGLSGGRDLKETLASGQVPSKILKENFDKDSELQEEFKQAFETCSSSGNSEATLEFDKDGKRRIKLIRI